MGASLSFSSGCNAHALCASDLLFVKLFLDSPRIDKVDQDVPHSEDDLGDILLSHIVRYGHMKASWRDVNRRVL
jgi:hypothetical protein